ncbi:thymidine kinase [Hellea sp.]|jgi:thymidine kinase|nr:thymidine kinase [Hellea sp.]MBT5836814.1 thymidine kinase [Hellea sp.]MDA8888053.1 thymidine kinase [Hellea sp.]MDB4845004.1 thymidine kinase [Hellea sp.]MDC1061492.1 thymidine kinase [Hellea sp.]MDG1127179.1 thymidine kinase [Hellea sp.]
MAKLYFSYSAMNAGKSAILLQSAYNYHERGMKTLLLKPEVDTRDPLSNHIVSRIGIKAQAEVFSADTNLEEFIKQYYNKTKVDCILLDESQFLTPDQVWQLASISDDFGIPVMCYGLRTDFKGNLFPGSATMLAIADDVREIRTLCWCGRKATMTMRFDAEGKAITDGNQVDVGGNEKYISLCRRHWLEKKTAK